MIVKSILDTDLYKFTTSYAYMKLFPHAIGTFEFFDRDNTEYTEEFVQQLWIEISNFCSLKLTHDEVKVIYAPDITICSTAIRKWVDDGRIILPFVTDEVNSIIRKLGLYK